MAQMLRHKETGELFIYTPALAALAELELVVEDPVAKVIAEVKAEAAVEPAPVVAQETAIAKKKSRFGK